MKQTRREFVRTLFIASQAVVAGQFLPGNLFAAETAADEGLKFLIFGDWGRKGLMNQTEVAAEMAKAAKQISAKFVISVGDNFYEDGVASASDPQWKTSFENVYADEALQVPWHVILGNHDYRGVCEAQFDYAKTSSRWKMPARYFLQTHKLDAATTADFFYLDTSPMLKPYHSDAKMGPQIRAQDVPKQIAWLSSALAASKAQWKIVIGHHPVYSGGEHGDTPELIEQVLPLMKKHGVQAYFNGHDHDLQHLVADDLNFFCSGAGSKIRATETSARTKFAKGVPGFTTVALSPEKLSLCMIDHLGAQLYATTVPHVAKA